VLARSFGAPRSLPLADDLGDLADDLFAVAEDDQVDEVGEGLGVVGAVTADDHERVLGAAVGARTGTPARSTQLSTLV
jgi:hypothetical protein